MRTESLSDDIDFVRHDSEPFFIVVISERCPARQRLRFKDGFRWLLTQ